MFQWQSEYMISTVIEIEKFVQNLSSSFRTITIFAAEKIGNLYLSVYFAHFINIFTEGVDLNPNWNWKPFWNRFSSCTGFIIK